MKKSLLLLLCLSFLSANTRAQAPQLFKYQSIARNTNGEPLVNAPIGVRISIRDISSTGTILFQETHDAQTNAFGLYNLNIGDGSAVTGSIANIDWSVGAKFIEVEADLSGGTNYLSFSNSELLSVPYALHANSAGSAVFTPGTAIGNTMYWNGNSWVNNSQTLFNNGIRIGIGTSTPIQKLAVQGNITVSSDSSYMINNKKILWNKGTSNIFVGENAGAGNSLGFMNTMMGFNAGVGNIVGFENTFIGGETGVANIDGIMNSFLGRRAGFSNTNGNENTFIGAYAGQSNTTGQHNTIMGVTAGSSNSVGNENTFLGAHAGYFNDLGNNNTFVGNFSGQDNISGNNNTTLGFNADVGQSGLNNSTAIGSEAIVTASNSVVIGSTAVTNIGGQVGWSTLSDKRYKTNVTESTLGLDFITRLKPVSYTYTVKGQENIRYNGLMAQDVANVLDEIGAEFSGIVYPQNDQDHFSIRYAEFVLPLINCIKEQQEQIKALEKKVESLEKKMNK
jgi:hypothetical protein